MLSELYESLGEKVTFPFLKSDTQSGEGFVLEGAENYLRNDCVGLELELFRYLLYQGVILQDQVKDYLKTLGFRVAGWNGYKGSFNASSDYLFLHEVPRSDEEQILISFIESVYRPTGLDKRIKMQLSKYRIISKLQSIARSLIP